MKDILSTSVPVNSKSGSFKYASIDRKLGLGESYTKAAPDVITVERDIDYKCPLHGVDDRGK